MPRKIKINIYPRVLTDCKKTHELIKKLSDLGFIVITELIEVEEPIAYCKTATKEIV